MTMSRTETLAIFYHLAAEQQQAIDWANGPMGTLMLGSNKEEFLEIAQEKLDKVNAEREQFLEEMS